jgi:hypothetical protein
MKFITFFVLVFTLNAFAVDKCRDAVIKQLPKNYKIMDRKAETLNPGEDTMYMMGEIWNDTAETLEYYGVEKSNGYYGEYFAFGASVKTCKIMRKIEIGDSLQH